MSRIKQHFTNQQLIERELIEAELSSIKPLDTLARKITTNDGFFDYFLSMQELYSSHLEAYRRLEEFYYTIVGHYKYSDYHSFRSSFDRMMSRAGSTQNTSIHNL